MSTDARIRAIETATGRQWAAWSEHLDRVGAQQMTSKQIESRAEEFMPLPVNDPRWWARQVGVVYQDQIGRGLPGQRTGHTYKARARTTVRGNLNQAMAAWMDHVRDRDSFVDTELDAEPSTTRSATWRRWRAQLADGTRLVVTVEVTAGGSALTVVHKRIRSREAAAQSQAWWTDFLGQWSPSFEA